MMYVTKVVLQSSALLSHYNLQVRGAATIVRLTILVYTPVHVAITKESLRVRLYFRVTADNVVPPD